MPQLPVVSGRQAIRAFQKAGFQVRRQRGSHIVMTKPDCPDTLSIPQHRVVMPGTLRALIRKASLTVEDFVELFS